MTRTSPAVETLSLDLESGWKWQSFLRKKGYIVRDPRTDSGPCFQQLGGLFQCPGSGVKGDFRSVWVGDRAETLENHCVLVTRESDDPLPTCRIT